MFPYIALIVVSLAIFAVVLQPLLEARRRYAPLPATTLADLRARRSYLLEALRDVELDYSTGKVDENQYEETRKTYLREAALVQRDIDEHTDQLEGDIDREIEQLRELARQQRGETERTTESS